MEKRRYWLILIMMVFLLCSIPAQTVSNASAPSKEDFVKNSTIDWMYKNMRTTLKGKVKKEIAYKNLNLIYNRVMQERFGEVKLSIIRTESAFDNNALGKMKEKCLMQINPYAWQKELKREGIINQWSDLSNVDVCINAGSYIFDYYYEKYGTVERAINAYNGGGDPEYKKKILMGLGSLKIAHEEARYLYRASNDTNVTSQNNTEVIQ